MEPQHDGDRPLIIDELSNRLEQFRLVGDSDDAAADQILGELGGEGKVEKEMIGELAVTQPLALPDRFPDAHRVAMRALEVLARNGGRPPSQLKAGPLTPIARYLVQQVIRYIVRDHQRHVIESIRDLYARRLAWIAVGDPVRMTMIRNRLDVERALPSYKKSGGGIPTFLVGGAAVSSVSQVALGGATAVGGSGVGIAAATVAAFLLLAGASWVILRGAAVARRRIKVSLDRPLQALWETIGSCGKPPKDSARTFAALAIVITIVGWLAIPLGAFLFIRVL
jgi:hypothetical protein